MYNFDQIVARAHTSNVKYDLREMYFGNADVMPMWVADMDFETPDFITQAVQKRAAHPVYGYTFMPEAYYSSIIIWLQKRHCWPIEKDWMIFSPGIVPAINFAVQAFTKKGEGVIVQPPVYFPFFSAIEDQGRRRLDNQLIFDGERYRIDFDDLEKKAKDAQMIFISNPHNPVGRSWTKDELQQMADICMRHDVVMISDEIHNDIVLPGHKHQPMALVSEEANELTVSCIAPSKTFNIAGLSTSTVIIKNPELHNKFKKVLDDAHIQSGNLFGIEASIAAYTHGEVWLGEMLDYLQNNFNFLADAIHNTFKSIRVINAESTYLAWLDFRDCQFSDEELKELLVEKAGLGLSPGSIFGPGGEGFQRMNFAAPKSVVTEAVARLKKVFN